MSTQRSLKSLIDRATSTLIAKTGQHNPAIDAIACAIAGVSYGQYGYQDQLFRELHPETCSEAWLYLHAKRHKTERLLPTFSTGLIRFEQLGDPVVIPKGTIVKSITGNEYETLSTQYSNEDIDAMALMSGSASNLPSGAILKLTKGIGGVNPDNVICLGFDAGSDIEELEHWRQRVCTAFNKGEEIGRREDYVSWAKSAHTDVDFAWALDNTPMVGHVQVYIGTKENDPTLSPEVISIVQEFIDKERLAGCHPSVVIPSHKPIPIEIQNVHDEVVRANIVIALENLFKSKMGARNTAANEYVPESITPTEIVLAIAPITSNYIVKQPTEEQFVTNTQVHTLGAITWTALN